MPEEMFDQEGGGFTFTEQDFERRYDSREPSAPKASGSGHPASPVQGRAPREADSSGRSHNKFVRTLLRRRFFSSMPI
jgi:hypothetical protein